MLKNDLQQYNNLWIYGAGKNGRKLLQIFSILGIACKGIVTSKRENIRIPGTTICTLEELQSEPENSAFILTMDSCYHDEVKEMLRSKGYENIWTWGEDFLTELWKSAEYRFADRRKGFSKCCFLLAGYKEFLWDDVMDRLIRFLPQDVEVCILSSGCYSDRLSRLAEEMNWSYLSTTRNSVTMIQNIAFALYEDAGWIYKMDEDMFITGRSFDKLLQAYEEMDRDHYRVGIAAPLIPVNGYGYLQILNEQGLWDQYEDRFGKVYVGGNPNSEIECNPETAVFMWDRSLRLDDLNRIFEKNKDYHTCSVRFSIGLILMKRDFWADMGGLSVSGGPDMGLDEEEVCAACMNRSRAIVVCHNTVVGHFSFGKQTERMKEYYRANRDRFRIM